MDGGYYRGTTTDQDIRFVDKEKKLMKQMKFETWLEQKVDMTKVNLDVLKPWITAKLNQMLGMEDEVLVNMVFFTLEETKNLDPKKLQINLTGFLNAKRAREFMGELWQMIIEAQNSEDGIPSSLIEKKMEELKAQGVQLDEVPMAECTENDWKHRYKSLTGGRYGKNEPNYKSEPMDRSPGRRRSRSRSPDNRRREWREDKRDERRQRERDSLERRVERRRERSAERDKRRERSRSPERRKRDDDGERRRRRSRSRSKERKSESPERREVKPRKFTEEKLDKKDEPEKADPSPEPEPKRRRKESGEKKSKKHKKEKKKKHKRDRHNSDSD
ncbi:unnamed protein product [Bursaphelenchus xylophilus]|nr:unnamed protein product [Bursaphelenchus xylophilus]CAG9082947.1 unnamed protein product [Bursaphelenchus xylophilus]